MDSAEFEALQRRRTLAGERHAAAKALLSARQGELRALLDQAEAEFGTQDLKKLTAMKLTLEGDAENAAAEADDLLLQLESATA